MKRGIRSSNKIYVANETGKSRGWPGGYTFPCHINRLEIAIALSFARSLSPRELLCVCWRGFRPLPRRRGRRRWKLYLRLSHFPARKGPRRGLRRKGVIPNCGGKSCYPLCRYWTADQEAEFHRTSDFSNTQAEPRPFSFRYICPHLFRRVHLILVSTLARPSVPRIAHFSAQRCLLISRPSASARPHTLPVCRVTKSHSRLEAAAQEGERGI